MNVIERAVIMTDDKILPEHCLTKYKSKMINQRIAYTAQWKKHIEKVLQHTKGKQNKGCRIFRD
jgi:hypothetical protein